MMQVEVIFATEKIKKHADINRETWRSTGQTDMFFQPTMISPNGNIRSHVSIQDLQANDTCWNQTCKLSQCVAAVLAFTQCGRANANAGTSAQTKSGSGAKGMKAEEDSNEDSDEDSDDDSDEEEDEEEDAAQDEQVVDLLSGSSSENEKEEGGAKGKGREERHGSDSDSYEIVDVSKIGGVKEGAAVHQRRQTSNSLKRCELELQLDEIAEAAAAAAAKKAAEEGTSKKRESTVLCIDAFHSTLLCAPHVAESEQRAISASMPNKVLSIFARVVCTINACTRMPLFCHVFALH